MSELRVHKLEALLARVQQRRTEPRLVAVTGLGDVREGRSENTNLRGPVLRGVDSEPEQLSAARAPAVLTPVPLADSLPAAPSTIPPAPERAPSVPPAAATSLPAAPPAPAGLSTLPPTRSISTIPPAPSPPTPSQPASTIPPARPLEPAAGPARIAPAPALAFDSAVRVASSPRVDHPRSFGELLELSLALRPRA